MPLFEIKRGINKFKSLFNEKESKLLFIKTPSKNKEIGNWSLKLISLHSQMTCQYPKNCQILHYRICFFH